MGDTPQSGGPSVEHHPAPLHNHLKARRLGKGADVVERIGIGDDEVTVRAGSDSTGQTRESDDLGGSARGRTDDLER